MPSPILPESFGLMLMAFQGCFHAPSYANFQWLVAGWVQCVGRRTITAVALAAGAVGERHVSVFHRFFARAQWALDWTRWAKSCSGWRWPGFPPTSPCT